MARIVKTGTSEVKQLDQRLHLAVYPGTAAFSVYAYTSCMSVSMSMHIIMHKSNGSCILHLAFALFYVCLFYDQRSAAAYRSLHLASL